MAEQLTLDDLLAADPADSGCDEGSKVIDQYVELELSRRGLGRPFPGSRRAPALVSWVSSRSRRNSRRGPRRALSQRCHERDAHSGERTGGCVLRGARAGLVPGWLDSAVPLEQISVLSRATTTISVLSRDHDQLAASDL